MGAEDAMPAFATTMSTPPNSRAQASKAARTWASSVTSHNAVLSTSFPAIFCSATLVSSEHGRIAVQQHDARALGQQTLRGRTADATATAGDQRDLPSQRLGFRHALQLRFLQRPIFDVERFLLIEADIAADRLGSAHDVDRVAVELARPGAPWFCPRQR